MSKIVDFKRIHFLGAGGISMSSLAKLMLLMGHEVTGSDLVYSEEVVVLNEWGADIRVGHQPEMLVNTDLLVYSLAVPESDPELVAAREKKIPCLKRHEFLGELQNEFETVIAVAGTHGKTTTTGFISAVMNAAGELFTSHIGGNLMGGVGNVIYKGKRYFVTEACEYRRALLAFKPHIGVVLNAESDHPDTYSNLLEIYQTFDDFLNNIKLGGKAVVNGDCEYFQIKNTKSEVLSFGYGENRAYSICDVCERKNGCYGFLIKKNGIHNCAVRLSIPGVHNVYNATAAYAVCDTLGIREDFIVNGLESFCGVARRMEERGSLYGADVFIDYAHHPSELRATRKTAEGLKPKRLIAVFQPHTYTRTKELYKDFIRELCAFPTLYIYKEYAARETENMGMTAFELFEGIKACELNTAYYFDSMLSLAKAIASDVKQGDIILILGAGDINMLADLLVEKPIYD